MPLSKEWEEYRGFYVAVISGGVEEEMIEEIKKYAKEQKFTAEDAKIVKKDNCICLVLK